MSLHKNAFRLGILTICALFAGIFCSGSASATTAMNVAVTSGMTIRILDKTGTQDISSIDLNLLSNPLGAYVSDNFIVEVATSAPNGYTLYVTSDYLVDESDESSCTNALVHQSDASYTVPTLANPISRDDFYYSKKDTGGVSSVNHWGWSVDDTTYKSVPECNSESIVYSTDQATSGSQTPVYVAANIDMAKAAGIYKNTLTFSAIAEPVPISYSLRFNGNTTDTVEDLPATLTGESTASGYTFTIPDTVPTRSGYEFKGWSTSTTGPTSSDSGSGEDGLYIAGDSFTILADGWDTQSTTLYAIWSDAKNFWTITYMQEMTPEICNSVYTPAVTNASTTVLRASADTYTATADGTNEVAQRTLYDIRDNNSYRIRKLADGNCWMTENLQLQLEAGKTYEGWGSYNDGTTFDLVPVDSSSTTSSWYSCGTDKACAFNGNTPSSGGWYTWYAATAGKGRSTDGAGTDIDGSICPKGWKLPYNYTVDNVKSYSSLLSAYGMPTTNVNANYVATLEAVPLSFSRAGDYRSGGLNYAGVGGHYWSSTVSGSATAYDFRYNTLNTYPQDSFVMYYGLSVRCLAL